jgi:hypothetical protein
MGMFNLYDEQAKQQDVGGGYGSLGLGRVAVEVAGQTGAGMGGAAMQGMGFKTPAQEKQAALIQVRDQFPDPQTTQEWNALGNALTRIDPDIAQQAYDQAKQVTGKVTATQQQNIADMNATLDYLEVNKGYKLNPREAAYFKSRIKKDASVTMEGQVIDTAPNVFDQIIKARKGDSASISDTSLTEAGLEKRVGNLSTKVLKADLSDLDVALTDAENMFAQYGDKNIPGLSQMNIIERQTEEGGTNAGIVEAVKNILLKLRSGAAVTESEQERFLKEISGTKVMTDSLWKKWIGRIRKLVEQKKKDLFAGERKDVLELYWKRQGTSLNKSGTGSTTKTQQDVLSKYNLK